MKILVNEGISNSGKELLESKGYEVMVMRVAQEQLTNFINTHNISILLVKNNTKISKEVVDACPTLELIGIGGDNFSNLDLAYIKSKGIAVIKTPTAAANAVAELVFAHLLGMVRYLHDSNRQMPLEGDLRFKELKQYYAKGTELKGKTIGIVGTGNTGKAVAKIALGLGMKVLMNNKNGSDTNISISYFDGQEVNFSFKSNPLSSLLQDSDFITLHTPSLSQHLIGEAELRLMKKGVGIINTATGGVLDEVALINFIEGKHVAYAALDVYETEPNPEIQLLMNPELSLSPHIGGATIETQERMGVELANQIIKHYE
ncbi:NAD(P)-dependent oxidoreductase [Pseudofulvibacter geojedonensis]|uniref:NAD(P)-dependent oxidoreductase n=1 Tax=Pseudofulvibacter geojedonensis TaxID=1123758 RepID=A0ABW3HYK5_9FLAO